MPTLPLLALLLALMPQLASRRTRRRSQPFTVASYNVSPEKRPQAVRRLFGLLARRRYLIFIGLQEAWWFRKVAIPGALRALGWRRALHRHPDTQALFRNRRGFRGERSGVKMLAAGRDHRIEPGAAGPTKADQRRINWVAGKQDGRPLVLGSTHLVPSVHLERADELSEAQVADIVEWSDAWRDRGYARVLVGDFNFPPDHPNAAPLREAGLRCVNRDDGWTHSKGTPGTRRLIDHVWVSEDVHEVGTDVIAGHRHDDHRIVLSRLQLV